MASSMSPFKTCMKETDSNCRAVLYKLVPSQNEKLCYLQAWEESLERVYPRVHDLSIKHVHIDVQRRVPLTFIARLPSGKNRQKA